MKRIWTVLIVFLNLISACKKNVADTCGAEACIINKPYDTYTYSIKPGTPEWNAFTTHQQMVDACQIPSDTLAKMSTEGVMQSCLDFPLLGDLLLNVGVDVPGITQAYMITFSGLIELSKRTDAGSVMLNRYKIMDPACAKCMSVDFTSNFSAFEMIIGHDSIQNKMFSTEKKILVNEATDKYQQKKNLGFDYYAYYGLSTSLYVCAKVMIAENYEPFVQLYKQNYNLQLFVEKLLWPADPNETDTMFKQIFDTAILFSK